MSNINHPKNNTAQKTERPSLINSFLWICAGVNRKILLQCPTDWAKYAGQGGLILFTALMAMLSGGFAFYSIFAHSGLSIAFGIFWGLLIFNLDRFIVNTMYSDGKYTISWGELLAGLPRLIIAVFIGIVISTPLELKIYEKEIGVKIKEMGKEKKEKYRKNDEVRIQELSDKIESLRAQSVTDERTSMYDSQNSELNSQLNRLYDERSANQKLLNASIAKRNQYDSGTEEYDKFQHDVARYQKKINQVAANIKATEAKISSNNTDKIRIMNEIGESKGKDIEVYAAERDSIKTRIYKDDYDKLIDKEYGGFQAKMLAFSELKSEKASTHTAALFISLLFIIIEVCPTFFKMMVASGPYDCLLDAERHSKKVESMKLISEMNDRINTEIMISTGKNKNRLGVELANNKALLEQVASVQSEILSTAVEKWRTEELEKAAQNPSNYIKSGHIQAY